MSETKVQCAVCSGYGICPHGKWRRDPDEVPSHPTVPAPAATCAHGRTADQVCGECTQTGRPLTPPSQAAELELMQAAMRDMGGDVKVVAPPQSPPVVTEAADARGTMTCPLCGCAEPHAHSDWVVERERQCRPAFERYFEAQLLRVPPGIDPAGTFGWALHFKDRVKNIYDFPGEKYFMPQVQTMWSLWETAWGLSKEWQGKLAAPPQSPPAVTEREHKYSGYALSGGGKRHSDSCWCIAEVAPPAVTEDGPYDVQPQSPEYETARKLLAEVDSKQYPHSKILVLMNAAHEAARAQVDAERKRVREEDCRAVCWPLAPERPHPHDKGVHSQACDAIRKLGGSL